MSAPARPRAVPRPLSTLGGHWSVEKRIRFSHCDPAGIVYFPRWFDLLNEVAEDWFADALGLDYHGFIRDGVGLGSAHAAADFFAPGHMGERIRFTPHLDRIGGASYTLLIDAHRGSEPILSARQVIVTTSLDAQRPIPLPSTLRDALTRYREKTAA